MKIVIAPNAFKNSLDASAVAKAIERGFQKSRLPCETALFPIADGGDDTLAVLSGRYHTTTHSCMVSGPLGRKVTAEWAEVPGEKMAIIEMARASGINLLEDNELDPLQANTLGTGELILDALNHGCKKIILGIGGSATIDGGLGIMMALGLKLFDGEDKIIPQGTNPLTLLHHVEKGHLDQRLEQAEFILLCDVENPLLGVQGAAAVFGPQKGADAQAVLKLEELLENYRGILLEMTGEDYGSMPRTGAAGGVAVPFLAFCNAKLVNGVDYLLENMGFGQALHGADLLVTAEGRADAQTLGGKGPFGVAKKAGDAGIKSILLAGKATDFESLNTVFSAVLPISNGAKSLEDSMQSTAEDLETTAWQLGNLLDLARSIA